jgi:hypothetical protein
MAQLRVTDEELRALLVTQLEVIEAAEFEKARKMAVRIAAGSRWTSSCAIWPSPGRSATWT